MKRNLLFIILLLLAACEVKKEAPECPAEEPEANTTVLKKSHRHGDWCRACVMGQQWASCQTVRAESESDGRAVLKARALERACNDAGYKKGDCPEAAIISRICKGDDKPGDSASAEALQRVFFENLKKQRKAPE